MCTESDRESPASRRTGGLSQRTLFYFDRRERLPVVRELRLRGGGGGLPVRGPPARGGALHASRGTSLPQLTLCMPSGRASHHPKDNTVSEDGWRSEAVSRLPQLLLILNGSTRRKRQSVSEHGEPRRQANGQCRQGSG